MNIPTLYITQRGVCYVPKTFFFGLVTNRLDFTVNDASCNINIINIIECKLKLASVFMNQTGVVVLPFLTPTYVNFVYRQKCFSKIRLSSS